MFSSQPCEIHGAEVNNCRLKFPQHHKIDTSAYDYSTKSVKELNLTESDIEKIIENAFESAKNYAKLADMTELLTKRKIYSLSDLSQFIKISLNQSSSKVVDYMNGDDSEDENDESEFLDEQNKSEVFDEEDQMSPDVTDDDGNDHDEEEEDNVLAKDLSNVERQKFQGCRIYDKVNPQHIHKYFRMQIGTSTKYVHKQTACWLLTNEKNLLSADRLIRVRGSRK
ncbi:unnamed protein product [Rotaria sp. Silwood2]|nr:unnamed protein product [Rotaria sp. Silwood2]CAF2946890.1 unnamed protein product [Rotaria sp. Silwood2]CAF3097433.1 unnamed protein product [Rotaria sp. Silwood2]CAF4338096.1 unnamed protein product [Rotaria sp. Silwood2]CAF4477315.1 unnamed protein product [Rotaria sp. Silwood2]